MGYNCEPRVSVIRDSISEAGIRLITFELEYWRPIHSELLTHRQFSRCARSSRATPIETTQQRVKQMPWGPKHWGINQPGMIAATEMNSAEVSGMKNIWQQFALGAAQFADILLHAPTVPHKQIVNRILEPYSSIQVVLSGTDFSNFFSLREASDAMPEMQDLAKAMHRAMTESSPEKLKEGEWHLPYITDEEEEEHPTEESKIVSAARCARVSRNAYDGSTSWEKDLELGKKLIEKRHMSPFEHVATPASGDKYILSNFRGWTQFRKTLPNEYVPEQLCLTNEAKTD